MIIDGIGKNGQTYEADVCVVGAGAAGLTLALDLAQRGLQVVMVESGGLARTPRHHKLLDAELGGSSHESLMAGSRERFFGGTTNHWGGSCRTLQAFDFEAHDWIPHSGWPISRADLDPYYIAAAKLLDLPSVEATYNSQGLGVSDLPRFIPESDASVDATYTMRVPEERLRFGPWRREEVANSPNIQCILNTTVVELHPDKTGGSIRSAEGRTFNGDRIHFRAKDYVLCTSAIENARLLLMSDSAIPQGLGNENDLVGRYFMIHVPNALGRIVAMSSNTKRTQEEVLSDTEVIGWAVSYEARKEHKLQGFHAFMHNNRGPGMLPYEQGVGQLAPLASNTGEAAAKGRKYFFVNWEQAPNPDSRVMLSTQRDALGARKPLIHLEVTKNDLLQAQRSAELLQLATARAGLGRMYITDVPTSPVTGGGGHQMGTTRMAADPKHGVTDANGRVHSLENLFLGGSSLFTTSGWQQPTFTIIALALRQASHLHMRSS